MRQGYYFGGIGRALKQLSNELDRLKIDVHLSRALRFAHGKFHILLATDDGADLSEPINTSNGLSYITSLSVNQLALGSEMRPASEADGCYDRPAYYKLQRTVGKTGVGIIHHSRIIEIQWDDGDGILEQVYEDVLRYMSVNANASQFIAKIDIIKTLI